MVPAPAVAQTARKLRGAPAKTTVTQKAATAAPAQSKGVHVLKTRTSTNSTPSLRKAMKGTSLAMPGARKAPLAAAGNLPEIKGSVTFSESWGNQNQTGLYSVNTATSTLDFLGPNAQYGGVCIDDVYYTTTYTSFFGYIFITVTAYDTTTGEVLGEGDPSDVATIAIGGITLDPSTGAAYGITYNSEGSGLQLSKLDYQLDEDSQSVTVTATAIGALAGNWNSIACDAQGQLYGISYTGQSISDDEFEVTSSTLCKLNKTTAAVTTIGETGKKPLYLSSSAIDSKSGRMFWNVCEADETGWLCELNLSTGAATDLFQYTGNDEIMGMYVPLPAAEDGAPAAATSLALDFADGSLSGNVTFKAPTTTYAGTSASGALTYTVLANGTSVATGSTSYGANVSAPVTLSASGNYEFIVTTANAAGTSPKAKIKAFIGKGTPAATTATLTYEGGMMKLSWTPVTTSADGGYIDPAAVTYTVKAYPAGTTVAEGLTATTFSEAVAEPTEITSFYYTVTAEAAGVKSAEAKSNTITLGAIVPPYTNDFDSDDALSGFTVIDANGDGKAWTISGGKARMSYNSSMDMDDWLISPPMKLEAGKLYKVTFEANANGASYPERVEAKWGTAATAAGMTNDLVPPTVLAGETPVELGNFIVPATDDIYYVGIHGISDADMFYLYVDNFSVGAAAAATIPGKATDLTVTPDPNCELKATVAFKAPAVDMAGNALTSITKIEVSRDGSNVKTFENPAPGAALSFTDTPTATGTYTYTVVASNEDGAGAEASESAFIGVPSPAAPAGVNVVETSTPGEVTVSWETVSTSIDGANIPSSLVTYAVCEYTTSGWMIVKQGLTGNSYTYQAVPAGEQDFVQLGVASITETGNTVGAGPMIPAGTPYDGLDESFADGTLSYAWGTGYAANSGAWSIFTDEKFSDISSCDGDNGFAAMQGQYLDSSAGLYTGKIDIAGCSNPGVSFYTYNIVGENPDINEIQLYVKQPADADWTALGTPYVVSEVNSAEGWNRITASLADYAGKVIQVRFQATTKQFVYTMIDKIKIGSMLGNDLTVKAVTAPEKVVAGADYTVDVTVANDGLLDAGEFTVELYADGTLAATETVSGLASGVSTTISFERTMSAIATEPVKYHAAITYLTDDAPDNNTSESIEVAPKHSNLPKVTDLTAEETAGGVNLSWSEPDLNSAPVESDDVDFEDAESWAKEYGDWTFVDLDQSAVGGFQNLDIPGITPGSTLASFFVFDASGDDFNQTFAAHSGDKYLAAIYRNDDGESNEWAISPALDGSAQTISFWARSYSTAYPEAIEMYYSTGSTTPADFVKVGATVSSVPGDWTKYTFEVPAGAKHFAIRSCATGSFMLMLDDFTFSAEGGTSADLSIVGYDVYRDGEKITAEPTGETEFSDATATEGTHSYVVVTVYTAGISAPSNTATVAFSGISDAMASAISITADHGTITVTGAEGQLLTVAAADGRIICSTKAAAKETVSAAPGIYVVKAGAKIAKVAVK